MGSTLQPFFKGHPVDVTEENVQSRVRGTILMALSNKFGHMVLSTVISPRCVQATQRFMVICAAGTLS